MSPRAVGDHHSRGGSDGDGEESFDWTALEHYAYAPLRRPLLVVVPWLAILVLSIAAFFFLPKRYKSSTLILVESEKVPDSFVARVATQDRGSRLEAIRPEILSRTRLERVVRETSPYPRVESPTAAVDQMRRSVFINISGNDGFTIEYVHTDPAKAQEVASRIATLFIEETTKAREAQVEGAVDFLATQVAESRRELESKDEAVRRYKAANMGKLPEQLQANLATAQALQQELRSVEESLIFAREKRDGLARRAETGSPGSPRGGPAEVQDLRRQLAELKGRYTDEHPDVESLRLRIARLDARLAASGDQGVADGSTSIGREQLEQANREVSRLEAKRSDLENRIAAIRARIESTPKTEQELTSLSRDYDKLSENYVALLSKQLEAQMAGRLEQRWKGDRFRILDPANLPEEPYFPKPFLVIGLGFVLGLFAGVGASLVAEFADPSVKDSSDLETVLAHPVLARIPHLPELVRPSAR